jgi:hypothetical protein
VYDVSATYHALHGDRPSLRLYPLRVPGLCHCYVILAYVGSIPSQSGVAEVICSYQDLPNMADTCTTVGSIQPHVNTLPPTRSLIHLPKGLPPS